MKAVVCYGNGLVKHEEYETPQVKPGTVKVAVKAAGICGSDIPRAMENGAHSYPIVLGHEFAGIVEEVGQGVKSLQVGDHVAGVPLVPCHQCVDCLNGNYALCKNYSFIGSRQQGAFADYVVIPERNGFKISPKINFEQGALFEPSTVSLHALRLADYQPGGVVAILGGGTMGVFALQWTKILGAKKAVVFGRDKGHLGLSKRLGADAVISTLDEDFMERAQDITDGRGFDYVFEAAGAIQTMYYAFELAGNKSTICFIGTPKENLTFTPSLWENMNRKEFHMTGSWMSYSGDFPGSEWKMTNERFANGQLFFDPEMFYQTFEMKDAQEAFNLFKGNRKVKGRILLKN